MPPPEEANLYEQFCGPAMADIKSGLTSVDTDLKNGLKDLSTEVRDRIEGIDARLRPVEQKTSNGFDLKIIAMEKRVKATETLQILTLSAIGGLAVLIISLHIL